MDALKRIWYPDTYDVDGNPADAVMERRGAALKRWQKKQLAEKEAELAKKEEELAEAQKKED